MMENSLYITFKAFLRYLFFFPEFFGYAGKRLDNQTKVNFKIHDVINWESNNGKVSNISRSKDIQTIKFRQLLE